jgi:hypothetical protein
LNDDTPVFEEKQLAAVKPIKNNTTFSFAGKAIEIKPILSDKLPKQAI